MKHYFNVFAHHNIALIILVFLATFSLLSPISLSAANETDAGDELISLTVKDEPLEDVLYKVSKATGYDTDQKIKIIIYDKTASEGVSSAPSTDKSFNRTSVPRHPASQVLEKEDSYGTEKKPSDKSVSSGQESETNAPTIKGDKKTKPNRLE